jgi:imidazolonepropionase-like amidohydrolase
VLTLRAGTVVVGDGSALEDAWVTVADGRIADVSSSEPTPSVAVRIDEPDATLLPGMIDCHVHLCLGGGLDMDADLAEPYALTCLKAAARARQTLAAGFTTVRTLGGKDGVELALRDAQAAGLVTAPRIRSANRIICMTGGHGGFFGVEADGADAARSAARGELSAGADCLKVTATGGILTRGNEPGVPQLDHDELAAVVREADKVGRHVAAHVLGREGLETALRAGVRSIEHGVGLDDELAGEMVRRGALLVPTLSCALDIPLESYPDWARDGAARVNAKHAESFAAALDHGVPIAFGTDCGVPGFPHGDNARELSAMVRQGVAPLDALTAATLSGARLLGLDDEIGTIAPDKRADLVLCPGRVTEDVGLILHHRDRLLVIQDGEIRAGTASLGSSLTSA